MFRDGHQLDVGEAHVLDVRHELLGQFLVGQPFQAVFLAPPGAKVDFVARHWRAQGVALRAGFHPGRVVPGVSVQVGDDRGGAGTHLGAEAVGIGFFGMVVGFARADVELVAAAGRQTGHEQLPDPGLHMVEHRVHAVVPAVEVADHADAVGVGRPHAKQHAPVAVDLHRMRAQPVVNLPVTALTEQIQVEFRELRPVAVGLAEGFELAFVGHGFVGIAQIRSLARYDGLEEAVFVEPGERGALA